MKNSKKSTIANVEGTNVENAKSILLDKLNSISISENVKDKSESKSIFKKEFQNKKDRSKCRDKFLNAIGLYLLFMKREETEKASSKLEEIKEICNTYYTKESEFKKADDYYTSNMGEEKRELIKNFIDVQQIISESI